MYFLVALCNLYGCQSYLMVISIYRLHSSFTCGIWPRTVVRARVRGPFGAVCVDDLLTFCYSEFHLFLTGVHHIEKLYSITEELFSCSG